MGILRRAPLLMRLMRKWWQAVLCLVPLLSCSSDSELEQLGYERSVEHPLIIQAEFCTSVTRTDSGADHNSDADQEDGVFLCAPALHNANQKGEGSSAADSAEGTSGLEAYIPDYSAAQANVQSYIDSNPPIASERAAFFRKDIHYGVSRALRAYGYYKPEIHISIEEADPDSTERSSTMHIAIVPGKPVHIRDADVRIIGEDPGYAALQEVIEASGVAPYAILNHAHYEQLKNGLLSAALAQGFFDARILDSRILVYEEQNIADIILIFDPGIRYKFGELLMDDETRELLEPARTLVHITPGQDYAADAINNLFSSLAKTGYYRAIDLTPQLDQAVERHVPLHVQLERQPHNIVRLGVGYSTDEGPRVMVEWDKPLLNRYGHALHTFAKVSAVQQNAQAVYKIPRRSPNTDYYYLRAAQEHTDLNDTLSDLSHLSFHYVANETGKWRRDYSLRAEYEDYEQGLETGHALNLMPGLLLSRRLGDQGPDPRTALSFSIDMTGGLRQITDYTFFRGDVRYQLVLSPTDETRLVVRARQGVTWGRDSLHVPPSLRFFAGGDNSIRGYGYLQEATRADGYLKGSRYMTLGSAEFQFPFGLEKQRLAVFLDAGLATDDYEDFNDHLLGPGIGYRLMTDFGTVRLDLGYGLDRDPPGVRLHFGFGPEF